jgi:diguanylate cyclase (GGDEF)-like protein
VSSEVPEGCNNSGLLERWAECSEEGDVARYTRSGEASSLARAVESSLSRRRSTPELKNAAREWGSTLPSPSAVVTAVASLREAASLLTGPETDAGSRGQPDEADPTTRPGEQTVPARVLRILDRVLSEAMEGVSAGLRHAALVDPLTGCANRRALDEDLQRAVAGANRTGLDVSVAVIDLDGLKKINDSGGHAAGDACLCDLTRALRSALRETDQVYRVGGDEFVVLMPFTGAEGASATMQRAQAEGAPSFSWGAASLSRLDPGSAVEKLLDLADASLYASRRRARRAAPVRSSRRRAALASAAAAAIAGIGSTVLVLQPSADENAIGANAPTHPGHHVSAPPGTGVSRSDTGPVLGPVPTHSSGPGPHSQPSRPVRTADRTTGRTALPVLTVSTKISPSKPGLVAVVARPARPVLRTAPVPQVSRMQQKLREIQALRALWLKESEADRLRRNADTWVSHDRPSPARSWGPWFHFPRQRGLPDPYQLRDHSSPVSPDETR